MKFTIESADYHRNGVTGEGFYVGTATCEVDGYPEPKRMLITFFPHFDGEGESCPAGKNKHGGFANARIAVLNLDEPFDIASRWRGDHFYEVADAIVAEVSARH